MDSRETESRKQVRSADIDVQKSFLTGASFAMAGSRGR
jgi:hypothetical protein